MNIWHIQYECEELGKKECGEVEETAQEIARSPHEPSHLTCTATIAPVQQPMQKGAGKMIVQEKPEMKSMNRNIHMRDPVRKCIETEDENPMMRLLAETPSN